tara:strand:- start:324 stop:692 length:369 start_codon:yes stop_codon:yes gene_type:complete
MAVTHTWSVKDQLKTRTQDGLSKVVFSVVWKLFSEETVDGKTYTTSSANKISLNTDNLDSSTFIAFADLTKNQVVGWVKTKIDADIAEGFGVVCAEWEAGHKRNIAKQINPPTAEEKASWVA